MQPGLQPSEETATTEENDGLMRPSAFHDATGHGDAFIANVDLGTSDQFRNVSSTLAAKGTGQSFPSKHVVRLLTDVTSEDCGSELRRRTCPHHPRAAISRVGVDAVVMPQFVDDLPIQGIPVRQDGT
jgi:hypothetical protein